MKMLLAMPKFAFSNEKVGTILCIFQKNVCFTTMVKCFSRSSDAFKSCFKHCYKYVTQAFFIFTLI